MQLYVSLKINLDIPFPNTIKACKIFQPILPVAFSYIKDSVVVSQNKNQNKPNKKTLQALQTAVSRARSDFKQPFFTEVMMLAVWNIWKQRNGKKIEAKRPSFTAWKREFIHDISMLEHRIKSKHHSALKA